MPLLASILNKPSPAHPRRLQLQQQLGSDQDVRVGLVDAQAALLAQWWVSNVTEAGPALIAATVNTSRSES